MSHFDYQRVAGDSEDQINGQGLTTVDIEAKIQEFEIGFGQLDLVSAHIRKIGQEFKKAIYD